MSDVAGGTFSSTGIFSFLFPEDAVIFNKVWAAVLFTFVDKYIKLLA